MLSFREVFKMLIDLTNTKLSTIAYHLAYDISYISKWNSGKKLPSYKNINEINNKLADMFSISLIEENKIDDFLRIFKINNREMIRENADDCLKPLIYKLLSDSYNSINSNNHSDIQNSTKFIFKNNYSNDEFKEIFKKLITSNSKLDIWATFDISSHYCKLLLNVLNKASKKETVINFHVFCKKSNINKTEFLKFITANSSINIELYESNREITSDFILVKDIMYLMINDQENEFYTMSYGNEIDTLFEFTSYINNLFESTNKIINLANSKEIAQTNYRKYFYSDNEFLFLSNYGFEFLIPNYVLDDILILERKNYKEKKEEIEDIKFLWSELFINSNINFLTTRRNLLKYLETGDILYCSIKTNLNQDYLKIHLKNIIDTMKNNPKINFYIINDDRFLKAHGLDKFNFFVNENNMYFKKTNHSSLSPISIVEDVEVHNNIYMALHEIMNSPFSKKYSADELEDFFSKYSKVFQKISDKNI